LHQALSERWPGQRIAVLFNTNWRDEHTGLNAAARGAAADVMAHENTKLWLGATSRSTGGLSRDRRGVAGLAHGDSRAASGALVS
jgi:hypothetical protein